MHIPIRDDMPPATTSVDNILGTNQHPKKVAYNGRCFLQTIKQ